MTGGSTASQAAVMKYQPDLSVAGGISGSSARTAIFENAAALTYTTGASVRAYGVSSEDRFKEPTTGVGLMYGGDIFAIEGGYSQAMGVGKGKDMRYALAAYIPELAMSLGAAGHTQLSNGHQSTFNGGFIFNPLGSISMGLTAMGFTGGIDEVGSGVSIALNRQIDFVLDTASTQRLKPIAIAPGLRFNSNTLGLEFGYGIPIQNAQATSRQIQRDFSAGAEIKLMRNVSLHGYYRQIEKLYAALAFGF